MTPIRRKALRLFREAFLGTVRVLVGAYPHGVRPEPHVQTVFFANHTSHLDTLTLLAALSLRMRARTRPVAAKDYWSKTPLRNWVATLLLNVVFVERMREEGVDALASVKQALEEGYSLIIFPEGTRAENELPGEFKSGLFNLAQQFPEVRLTPVYLENLHRILPKGSMLPLPLINKVHFGQAIPRIPLEPKASFLARAREAVCALSPGH